MQGERRRFEELRKACERVAATHPGVVLGGELDGGIVLEVVRGGDYARLVVRSTGYTVQVLRRWDDHHTTDLHGVEIDLSETFAMRGCAFTAEEMAAALIRELEAYLGMGPED